MKSYGLYLAQWVVIATLVASIPSHIKNDRLSIIPMFIVPSFLMVGLLPFWQAIGACSPDKSVLKGFWAYFYVLVYTGLTFTLFLAASQIAPVYAVQFIPILIVCSIFGTFLYALFMNNYEVPAWHGFFISILFTAVPVASYVNQYKDSSDVEQR